jgi:hypothetical protein
MDYALKERIGKPELFTGRKEELTYFLKWIADIKEEKSQSTVMPARCSISPFTKWGGTPTLLHGLFDAVL